MTASADLHAANKLLLAPFRAALNGFEADGARATLRELCASDVRVRMCAPFGDLDGADAFFETCLAPLMQALPDGERRDWIVVAGPDSDGAQWVGCGGHYMGTMVQPFLDIPPTGHLVHMRFHEFYRVEEGKVVEIQAIWDLPELMMQAGVWPMAPSLGREFCVPGPATQDGLSTASRDEALSARSAQHVVDMLTALVRYPTEGEEAMNLPDYWHERMNWYGPAGTGTARGIRGFRNWHQTPFVTAMPDRGQYPDKIKGHLFGDNLYVGVTGWPDMHQTLTGSGWMGVVASGKPIDMRSLDFWRLEPHADDHGRTLRIRENWVLWDMIDVLDQLGMNIFDRVRDMAKPFQRTVPDNVWKF